MKKVTLVLMVCLMLGTWLKAQDPQFSQYYASPLYLNPGFTGSNHEPRLAFNSRVQWTALPQAFTTFAASADFLLENFNSGFGILAMTDRAGSAALRTTTIAGLYASKIRLSEKWVLSPGLMFGFGQRSIDLDKLVFGDQIQYNGPTTDDAISQLGNRSYFDFSSGAVIYNKSFWAGFSAYHINSPNHSLLGEQSKLPMRLSAHVGIRIPIKHGPLAKTKLNSVSPSIVFTQQGEFQQFDVGANVIFDPILVGLWYRGVPLGNEDKEKMQHDAIIFMIGLNMKYLEVGYSYDLTVNKLGPASGGSHELSVVLLLQGFQLSKTPKKSKFLPCPNYTGFQWRE
jgi:type IX secretion system PorP/SprF family membrane protein